MAIGLFVTGIGVIKVNETVASESWVYRQAQQTCLDGNKRLQLQHQACFAIADVFDLAALLGDQNGIAGKELQVPRKFELHIQQFDQEGFTRGLSRDFIPVHGGSLR